MSGGRGLRYNMKKENCKYCKAEEKGGPMIIENYDEKESKLYAEHLKHKHN